MKGLDCVYDLPSKRTLTADIDGEAAQNNLDEQNGIGDSGLGASLPGYNTFAVDLPVEEDLRTFDFSNITGDIENNHLFTQLLPSHMEYSAPHGVEKNHHVNTLIAGPRTNEPGSFDSWMWPHASIQPRMGHVAQFPWSAWTTSVASLPVLFPTP